MIGSNGQGQGQANRESWLLQALPTLAELISGRTGHQVPATYLSIGWPKGARGGKGGRTIGQCWPGCRSADGSPHVFISPELSDAGVVLATLLHELVHAAVEDNGQPEPKPKPGTPRPKPVGHKGEFVAVAKAIGLLKPWTATTAGPELGAKLADLLVSIGPYPHAALSDKLKPKPGSRLRLWCCPCGIKARVASDDFQATCGLCEQGFVKAGKEDV